ncbi:MAG: ABC transporter permease [Candidatus Tectomicrobia bacterium]|nr:ABC transporter permease [Candidatus Tectomicrobia bacterium]
MYEYILKRLVLAVPTLIGVTLLVSAIIRMLPGDVVLAMMAESGNLSVGGVIDQKALAQFRAQLGLDKPFHVWYVTWLWKAAHGDLGESLYTGRPVWSEIQRRWPVSFQLAVMAMFISVMIAIPIGVMSAIRQDSWIDYTLRFFAILGLAMPGFWVATMLLVFVSIYLQWTPALGYITFVSNPFANLKQFMMPALALGAALAASTTRMTRSTMLEVLRQDYIRTAWAKGLRERLVVCRHALKNAMIPVITIMGIQFGFTLGGTVIMETVFSLPGMGKSMLDSILQRDYPQLQGNVLVIATAFVIVNLIIDITYAWFDPRIRYMKK